MSANILLKTEALDDVTEWTQSDGLTVTSNTLAAPAFAGKYAGRADRVIDASAVLQCGLDGAFHSPIANDSSSWTLSVYVAKDAVTTRFPLLFLNFENGTPITVGISLDTSAGAVASSADFTAPNASGVVDVDTIYWRFWLRHANNSTGNNAIRARFQPAHSLTHGGAGNNSAQGTVDVWGFNLTNDAAVQTYQPDPSYAFVLPRRVLFRL